MTPRLGLCVYRVGLVIMVLCMVATATTQITYEDGPPENGWADNIFSVCIIPLFWVAVAIEEWETDFTMMGVLLLYAGGFLGLTVMAVGLAMAGAGTFIKEGAPRIGLCVAVVGFLIAVLCSVHAFILDNTYIRQFFLSRWTPDATMTCQALWLLGGFVGFNLIVVGLVTAGVVALTRQPGKPVSSPDEFPDLPLNQLRERTRPIMPRQGLYVALVGLVIIVLCVAAGLLIIPDVALGTVPLYLGGFVGLVAIVVGLVMAAVGVVPSHLTVAVAGPCSNLKSLRVTDY